MFFKHFVSIVDANRQLRYDVKKVIQLVVFANSMVFTMMRLPQIIEINVDPLFNILVSLCAVCQCSSLY